MQPGVSVAWFGRCPAQTHSQQVSLCPCSSGKLLSALCALSLIPDASCSEKQRSSTRRGTCSSSESIALVPSLPPPDADRPPRPDPSACESSARRPRLEEQAEIEVWKQDQVAWGQMLANSPGSTGSRLACRRTRTRLPHFWHQRAYAPIWHP